MDAFKKLLVNQKATTNDQTKPNKQDANLKYSPTLYFLVGLAITLFSTYSLLEMKFRVKNPPLTAYTLQVEDSFAYDDVSYVEEKEKLVVQKKQKKTFQT